MDDQYLRECIKRFLAEDIGQGDITSEPIFPPNQQGKAVFLAKEDFIACGFTSVAPEVFRCQNKNIVCSIFIGRPLWVRSITKS